MGWNASEWLLDRHVRARRRRTPRAARGGRRELSYADLLADVDSDGRGSPRATASVRATGWCSPSSTRPSSRPSFLACLRIGAIAVLVNPLLPWRDIGVVVDDAEAALVLVSAERAEGSEELDLPRLVTGSRRVARSRERNWRRSHRADRRSTRPASGCAPRAAPVGRSSRCTATATCRSPPRPTRGRSSTSAPTTASSRSGRCSTPTGSGNSLTFPMAVGRGRDPRGDAAADPGLASPRS